MSIVKPLIVVLGPTASGKSDLAVKIAKEFNGEIVSADSRQVYKGMNIGTGKITPDTKNSSNFSTGQAKKKHIFTHKGIPHYMLDMVSPKKQFSVAQYKKLAENTINKITKKGETPVLCGGTGFYIQAVADNIVIPEVKPNWELREKLEKKSVKELLEQLKKLDQNRAQNIDAKNKRRLIRAIEIILKTKKPVPQFQTNPQYDVLYLGIKKSLFELKKSINKRVDKMIKIGLEKEVKSLVKKYGWTMVLKNAIGYQEWRDSKNKKEIANAIKLHTLQFAKRQITWFNKYPGKKINWVKSPFQAEKLVKEFLS